MNIFKLIFAAAAIAAAIAAPAAAAGHPHTTASTASSVPGSQYGADRVPVIHDCVHVTFPQCGDGPN